MKLAVINQRLFASLSTLAILSVVGIIALASARFTNVDLVDSVSLFSPLYGELQERFRALSIIVAAYFIIASSVSLGRLASIYKLYDRACFIQLPIAAMLAWSVAQSSNYLISASIVLVVTLFIRSLFRGVRSDVSVAHLFNASLLLSILPMLYAPAIVLWAILPVFLISVSITLRDWLISLVGLALPPMVAIYVSWLMGGDFGDVAQYYWTLLWSDSGVRLITEIPIFEAAIAGITLLLSLLAMLFVAVTETHPRTKMRQSVLCMVVLAGALTVLFPSASLHSISLMVPAMALLATLALVRLHDTFASVTYLLLLLLFVLDFALPLSISF